MTQTFVDQYMENDNIYKIIGFARDNVALIVGSLVAMIVSFYTGKIYGTKTQKSIVAKKEEYQNIEAQKIKLRKQIERLGSLQGVLTKLMIMIFLGQCGLIFDVIYNRGFDYSIIFENTVTRNLLLSMTAALIVLMILKKSFLKMKSSKVKYLANIHSELEKLATNLIADLGPELIAIVKSKLQGYSFYKDPSQIEQPKKEVKPKTETKPKEEHKNKNGTLLSNAELNELKKKIIELEELKKKMNELESFNLSLTNHVNKEEVEKKILLTDLARHKRFLHNLKAFEWCESCIQHAGEAEEEKEQEEEKKGEDEEKAGNSDLSGASNPEKTHPKEKSDTRKSSEEHEVPELKEPDENVAAANEEGVKKECQNKCLERYFKMGMEMSNEFNHQGEEIKKLRQQFMGPKPQAA